MESLSGATMSSGCSPRNLSVKCSRASPSQPSDGAAVRSGAVTSTIARRRSGSRLMARKSRTALEHVQGSGTKSARVQLDPRESRGSDRVGERLVRRAVSPALEQRPVDLSSPPGTIIVYVVRVRAVHETLESARAGDGKQRQPEHAFAEVAAVRGIRGVVWVGQLSSFDLECRNPDRAGDDHGMVFLAP